MSRPHAEVVHVDDFAPEPLPAQGWPDEARAQVLSRDAETGALTARVMLPPGWRRGEGQSAVDVDVVVLAGSLRFGEAVRSRGYYEWTPAGAAQPRWVVGDEGCELLLLSPGGAPDFAAGGDTSVAGRIELETPRLQWQHSAIPGPPPGMFIKVLRHDDATGEGLFLASTVPRYDYPRIEYHDCVEEAYMVGGDIRMGTSGLMVEGSYFWRPPYITHGPFFSLTGMLALIYVDSPLVNHFVDDPRRTPEENRAEAEAEGPPPDYLGGEG